MKKKIFTSKEIIFYASLQNIYQQSSYLSKPAILEGIKREFEKEEGVFKGE